MFCVFVLLFDSLKFNINKKEEKKKKVTWEKIKQN